MINNIHLNPFAISGLLTAITCTILAIVVLLYGNTKMHKVYAMATLSVVVWGVGSFLIGIAGDKESAIVFWKFAYAGVIFIPVLFLHALLLFFELRNSRLLFFSYFQAVTFLILLVGSKLISDARFMFNSIYYLRINPLFFLSFIIWIFLVSYVHYVFLKEFKAFKKRDKNKQSQLIYYFVATLLGFYGGITNFLPGFGWEIYPYGNFGIPIYSTITTFAILRHQLMDIRIVIKKSFIYSVLVALITATYLIFVVLAERLFQGMVGYTSLVVSILYAFVIALFFTPVKNRIQHLADRIFLGKDPIQIARENELMRQEIERSERLKAVAHFASGMAHEIKNPLAAIKTFAEYLPEKKNDPEFLNKFSKIVSGEVGRIDSLVHQLLDFAKPTPLNLQEIDIHNLLDDTLNLLSNDFLKHSIKLIKNYNANNREFSAEGGSAIGGNTNDRESIRGNSPEISGNSCLIKADLNKLKQAFLNLFLNSIDAMPSGGILTVSTRNENQGSSIADSVLISISDTGCGIPEKDLPHIFEPFYSTKEEGTGLGLSIVYSIIKEHNGNIKVESKINQGVRIIIELPENNL